MGLHGDPRPAEDDARGFPLVVLAYRSVMAELSGAPAKYRADVWEVFEAAAPPGEAEALFGHVFAFARALVANAERPLQWRRTYCAHLCRDEWLALSMVAAAERVDVAGLLADQQRLEVLDAANHTVGIAVVAALTPSHQPLVGADLQKRIDLPAAIDMKVLELCDLHSPPRL